MKTISVIGLLFLHTLIIFAQNNDCAVNFYRNNSSIIQYQTFNEDSIPNYSLFTKKKLDDLRKVFESIAVKNAIDLFKKDSVVHNFFKRYSHTDMTSGIRIEDYATIKGYNYNRKDYYSGIQLVNEVCDSLIQSENYLNISIFYFDPSLDCEVYVFERGLLYAGIWEFIFKEIYNPIIESPIFPYSEGISLSEKKNIGLDIRKFSERIVIPIIEDNRVIYNIEIVSCK